VSTPEDLKYTAEHEWVTVPEPGSSTVRIGITDYAQQSLGDIVYVNLPEPGTAVTAGDALGEVESTKSVSDVYAPLTGTVTARNDALADAPETVNSDPYGEGWLVEVEISDPVAVDGLLDAEAYAKLVE
jgi:glycine cleavage system H protein